MSDITLEDSGQNLLQAANKALSAAAKFWFLVAAIGQGVFATYIIAFYGRSTIAGNYEEWNKVLSFGYIPGDNAGNAFLGAHVILAIIITVGGLFQLVPQIRERALPFHRWNGRIYMVTAIIVSLSGIYLTLSRGNIGGAIGTFTINTTAVLVFGCAAMAWRYVRAGDIVRHRRWALRLFMAASAVWFFRVGIMFWLFVNQGPVGFDMATFSGPFITFLDFAQFALPLAVLELYLRTQDSAGARGRYAMAGGLVVCTLVMAIGIFAASMSMWLPRM